MQNDYEATPVDIQPRPRPGTELDVVAVGNALVDVLASATDEDVQKLGLVKGTMAIVDRERSEAIYATMGPTVAASGGSAANTVAGVAALGGARCLPRPGGRRRARSDVHPRHSLHRRGFRAKAHAGEGGRECDRTLPRPGDRRCRTDDGDPPRRGLDFASVDLHTGQLSSTQVAYFEGYLWDQEAAKVAMRESMDLAHENDAAVALSLSDPFCVQNHQDEFLELLNSDLDILFANEDEIKLLFGTTDLDAAVSAVEETGVLAALTQARPAAWSSPQGGRCRCQRFRWTRWWTPPERGTCSPPVSSMG